MGHQGQLHIGRGDAGHGHDGHIAVVQESLDAGTLAGALVLADEIAVGQRGRCAVETAGQLETDFRLLAACPLFHQFNGGLGLFHSLGGHIDQLGLGEHLFDEIGGGDVKGHILIGLRHVFAADLHVHFTGLDGHLRQQSLIHHLGALEGGSHGDVLALHLGHHAVFHPVGALQGHHIACIELLDALQGVFSFTQILHDLALALAGRNHGDDDPVAPCTGVLGFKTQAFAAGQAGHCRIGRGHAHYKSPGTSIGEKVADSMGQVAIFAEFALLQIAAELPVEIGNTGDKHRSAGHGALFCKAYKTGGAGAHPLHGSRAAVKFLHIDTGRQIFCHTLSIHERSGRNQPGPGSFHSFLSGVHGVSRLGDSAASSLFSASSVGRTSSPRPLSKSRPRAWACMASHFFRIKS